MKKNNEYFVCDKEGYLIFNQAIDAQNVITRKTHLHATKNSYYDNMLIEIEERLNDHIVGSELKLIGRLIISSHLNRAHSKGKLILPEGIVIEPLIDYYAKELPHMLAK